MSKLYKIFAALFAVLVLSACQKEPNRDNEGAYEDVAFSNNGTEYTADSLTSEGYEVDEKFSMNLREGDRVLFAFDSSSLDSSAKNILKAHAVFIEANPDVKVVIEGHADERGTVEYNLALGERRAKAARNYLISLGVSGDRVSTISYGESKPAVASSTPSAWKQNRRAVTVVYNK